MILSDIGYFEYKYKFHNIPNSLWSKIIYFIKAAIINIAKPFKNKFLNKIQDWHIIDCNIRFEYSKKYFIEGDSRELRALKNILINSQKPSKGKITTTSKCLDYIFFIKNPNNFINTFFIISKEEFLKRENNLKNMKSNSLIILCKNLIGLEIQEGSIIKNFNFKRLS